MTERWAPGWLPQGWRRGDRLQVWPPKNGTDTTMLHHDPIDALERKMDGDDIAFLCVQKEEQPAAQAWLEWFFGEPSEKV